MIITSRATDYALLLVMELAKLEEDERSNIKKISSDLNLSTRFLANISNKLTTAGVINSHRGIGGGVRLAKNSDDITVKEILEAIDGPIQTMLCQSQSDDCSLEISCNMKFFWDELQQMIIDKLAQTSIKNLIEKMTPSHRSQKINLEPFLVEQVQ